MLIVIIQAKAHTQNENKENDTGLLLMISGVKNYTQTVSTSCFYCWECFEFIMWLEIHKTSVYCVWALLKWSHRVYCLCLCPPSSGNMRMFLAPVINLWVSVFLLALWSWATWRRSCTSWVRMKEPLLPFRSVICDVNHPLLWLLARGGN